MQRARQPLWIAHPYWALVQEVLLELNRLYFDDPARFFKYLEHAVEHLSPADVREALEGDLEEARGEVEEARRRAEAEARSLPLSARRTRAARAAALAARRAGGRLMSRWLTELFERGYLARFRREVPSFVLDYQQED